MAGVHCLTWVNPATEEVSFMKGARDAFYWERGFDESVIAFDSDADAEQFAKQRVNVPYRVRWQF